MTAAHAYLAVAALPLPEEIPTEAIPLILARLSSIQTALILRLMEIAAHEQPAGAPDELLTVVEAAARMKVSTHYLYRHSRKFPFTIRQGRLLRFSANGIDAYIWRQQRR